MKRPAPVEERFALKGISQPPPVQESFDSDRPNWLLPHSGPKPSLLQSPTLWSIARRQTQRRSLRSAIYLWNFLRQLPRQDVPLWKITCFACRPKESFGFDRKGYEGLVLISDLRVDCVFCGIIRQCFEHFVREADINMCYIVYGSTEYNTQLCFRKGAEECDLTEKRNQHSRIHVQIYSTESRNLHRPFQLSRAVAEDPKSAAPLETMGKWISDCYRAHGKCALQDPGFIPTRLIRLVKIVKGYKHTLSAQLFSPVNPVRFCALTYCWGSSPQPTTTRSNLSARYLYLNTTTLPQTLQDALLVSGGLGIEYVWIDSICIIQDDSEDWAREASKMAGIYSNAYVVLAATATDDCAKGFLHLRGAPLTIGPMQDRRKGFSVQARINNSHDCRNEGYKDGHPLFLRAWCMQETFLARRVIYFLPDEVVFECLTSQSCECIPVGAVSRPETQSAVRFPKSKACYMFRELRAADTIIDAWSRTLGESWALIVAEYSALALTQRNDILPALSGVAHCIKHLDPGEYIAGLWERDIAFQLGWRRSSSAPTISMTEHSTLIRPSFSWISSSGPVHFDHFAKLSALCHLQSFGVELATSDPCGRISGAFIRLSGRFIRGSELIVYLRQLCERDEIGSRWMELDSGFVNREFSRGADIFQSPLVSAVDWAKVACFLLYEHTQRGYTVSLLLQRKTDSIEYVRIGLMRNPSYYWSKYTACEGSFTVV